MTRRGASLLATIAAWMQPQRVDPLANDLAAVAAETLARCGLDPLSFDVHCVGAGTREGPMLLVTLRSDMPILWEYAQHVEAYVADRLERRSGYLVGRIVFTHQLSEAMDLREARRGVRLVYSALRGAPGAMSFSTTGYHSRLPSSDESALSSSNGGLGESVVAGLDIVESPQLAPLSRQ